MKWTYLVRLSITTITISNLYEVGNLPTKSILTADQGLTGIGRGCNNPADLQVNCFICWRTPHSLICYFKSDFIPSQKKSCFNHRRTWRSQSVLLGNCHGPGEEPEALDYIVDPNRPYLYTKSAHYAKKRTWDMLNQIAAAVITATSQ